MVNKPKTGTLKTRLLWGLVPVMAVAGVAIAQIPPDEEPPARQGRYVDSQNYDPEPYYVDGVEFKPYVPEGARKATNHTDTRPVAPQTAPVTRGITSGQPVLGAADAAAPTPVASAPTLKGPVGNGEEASEAVEAPKVPAKRQRHGAAIIQALDKVTAETVRFEARVGKPVRYKGLIYTVKACETTTDEEAQPDIIAYMEVQSSPQITETTKIMPKPKSIFRGWTYASSPGLNGLQHPVYDAWVISCRAPLVRKS
ncbi:DUF2155 domain-containing protein [Asticcacaulis endophyticus]|uniref:DUF2155 domain-containing protein n=1 Tax=Asticcacaulis endophyticus TaxID=1395890 RepID=A0A918UWA9_9CAUL|nr:DUF2155 domain-containing protein [Asticcacaulis endophyticus]GGZ40151.1 hypothetical protein GCM10011273_28520 [Asticcacaulis endophyticus]